MQLHFSVDTHNVLEPVRAAGGRSVNSDDQKSLQGSMLMGLGWTESASMLVSYCSNIPVIYVHVIAQPTSVYITNFCHCLP